MTCYVSAFVGNKDRHKISVKFEISARLDHFLLLGALECLKKFP